MSATNLRNLCGFIALFLGVGAVTPTARAQVPVSDDFHSTSLNTSLWTVVNPLGDGVVSLNGTDAVLSVPAGTAHDLWSSGDQSLRILQTTTSLADFQVEVKFDSIPTAGNQDEGIVVQTDANNYLRFDVYSDGTTQHMFAASFVNNNPTVRSSVSISGAKAPFWIRVNRTGNTWTQSWSVDGTNFTTTATFSYTLVVNQIGPYAGNCCGGTSPAFTAYVDYFFNSASPISPADGGMWDATTPPAISGINAGVSSTGATISWTTNQFSSSRVDYGTTASYGSFVTDPTSVLDHSVAVVGLTCGTQYHYKVSSTNSGALTGSSADNTFTTVACGSNQGPVSDDFHSTSLNTSLWTVVNPLGDGVVSLNGVDLVLNLPAGTQHDLWSSGNQTLRVLQATSNTDFQVEVKFDSLPTAGDQDQGVIVQTDANNYLRFDVYSDGTTQHMFAASFANNNPTIQSSVSISGAKAPFWMRVKRTGNSWTQSWSVDGTNFTTTATFSYTLVVNQIGPYAGNCCGGTSPAFTAYVDYFFNTASPISPADGGMWNGTTAPTISGIGVTGITGTGATVQWTTNQYSSSRVDYGTTASYGSFASNASLVLSHSIAVSGLACNTVYHYKVSSANSGALTGSSADNTFTTGSCGTGLTIANIVVTPGLNSATIAWTTNIPATSKVDYGLTSSYGTTDSDPTLVTTHSLSLTALTCSTIYHYKITSVDGNANSTSSTDSTFQTAACGGPVSDDFHGSTLNTSLWTLVAPCCGFVRMNGTDALLVVPAATSHDDWTAGNQTIRLMQPTANVDFGLEVKFDSLPSVASQDEGVLVQTDVNNYMRFDVYFDGTTQHMFAASFVNNNPTVQSSAAISGAKAPFWLRVQRTGNTWTQSWSVDGTNFTSVATFNYTLVANQVGPYAGNCCGTSQNPALGLSTFAPSFTAAVDYFFNMASRISPSDGGMAQPPNQPVINVWYGDNQTFGQNGIAQQWVNILGNVTAPSGIQSASYTLNGGAAQFLRVGPNHTRLVDTGDFNVEIDHASLNHGANTVVITATDNQNHTITHTVTVNWNNTGQVWPLPYSIDWSTVANIQDVAQVVDGQWAIQPDGTVRTTQVGYDRLLTLGDVSWTDYQVTAEMTINSFDCWQFGPGVLVGWSGHTTDPAQPQPDQPRTGHPFFGLGWYATTGSQTAPNAQLEIYANSPSFHETVLSQDTTGFTPALGVKYMVKFAVQRNPGNTSSHLSLKIWPANTSEPANWNLQANGDASTGSAVLASYRADVSFGKISIVALP